MKRTKSPPVLPSKGLSEGPSDVQICRINANPGKRAREAATIAGGNANCDHNSGGTNAAPSRQSVLSHRAKGRPPADGQGSLFGLGILLDVAQVIDHEDADRNQPGGDTRYGGA